MSKIYNSVYGLALGDAFGFITERMRFHEIVRRHGNDRYLPTGKTLQVSDDTQMSLALIEALMDYQDTNKVLRKADYYTTFIMKHFIDWMKNGNPRGAGRATKNSLNALIKTNLSDPHGSADTVSKGSGTVMRAPWVGLFTVVDEKNLETFSNEHSKITHSSPSAVYSAYLTSLITRKLFTGDLQCGDIRHFALKTIQDKIDEGHWSAGIYWEEIQAVISDADDLPVDWSIMSLNDIDICEYIGRDGRGDMVLSAAIAIADAYGEHDPIEGLRRAMMTGGDSDTIGAVAGAFIGASHEEDIWEDLPNVLETEYRNRMDKAVGFLTATQRNN